MKVVVLLVIVVFSTFVQSYKIRIIRRRYKHRANRTAAVDEQRTAPVHPEPQLNPELDNSRRTYQYKRRYNDQAPDETEIKVIPGPRINRVVANLCKDANKDILVVWETVARVLGLDKGYVIRHRGELRKLTTIIRTFVTMSKENNFEQMPLHQILQTIDYNLGRVDRNDIAEENIEAISRPHFEIPILSSSTPGNEEIYREHLETDTSGFNAESLSTEPISVPSLKTPNPNENILEPTNSVNLEDIETELPFEPSIDSNHIRSINTGRLVELENGYKFIPATPSFLDSDELITVISPGENAYDDISTEIPLDKETNFLTTASSLNPEELITVNTLQPIDDSLEYIHGDDVFESPQSAEDTSDDDFTGNTRKSFGTLLDQLITHLIEPSNVTLSTDGHDAIHENTNLYLDPVNKTPDYLNSHDSAENEVSSEDSADLDKNILSLSSENSASLESNNFDAINSQIDANDLSTVTNTLVTTNNSNLENPVYLTPIETNSNVDLVSVSPLYHHENISSEKHLDDRRFLKIEEDSTIFPVALQPDVINPLASTDNTLFRTPDNIQKPFKQITPYDVKTSQMNLDPVKLDDDKTRISIDQVDTSQLNPDIMAPYVVDISQRNPNRAVSEDVDVGQTNLDSVISYDEDTSVRNFDPGDPNDVETNQLNLGPSVLYDDVDNNYKNPDPILPYDLINPNAPFDVDTNRKNQVNNYGFGTSQLNADKMTPYAVDASQRNPNPAISEDIDAGPTNLDSIISYDEDTSVRNFDPVNPNDVEINQLNLGPSVPYDAIDLNAPYEVDTNLRNQVNNYDFDTNQLNADIMAPYVVDTSQRNPNPAISEDIDAGPTNLDSIISYDEDTSVRNFNPVNPNDVEINQLNLGPSVPYDAIDLNAPYEVDTNLRNQVNNYDFDTSQLNADIMAPYVIDTSQRSLNPVVFDDVDEEQRNQDSIISYDADTSVRNFDPVHPNDVETNQKNLGPSVPYASIDPNAPYDVDRNLRNLVNNSDFDTSQINPDIMAPYPVVFGDVDAKQRNQDSIISYVEVTSVRNFDPVELIDVETDQSNLGPSVLYDDVDNNYKNPDPILPYDLINPNAPFDVDTNRKNQVNNYDFDTSKLNADKMTPYAVDTSQRNPNPAISEDIDAGPTNLDSIISYDEDTSVRNFDPVNLNDVETNQLNLGPSFLRDDVDNNYENPDPTLPYDLINPNADTNLINQVNNYDFDTSQINPDIMAPYVIDTSQRNPNPAVSEDVDAGQTNLDSTISNDEDTSARNFNPVDSNDVETNQINLGPNVLYDDVDTSQKYIDPNILYDQIDPIVAYDVDANHTNIDLTVPYDGDINHRNLDPVRPDEVETRRVNLDTIAPYNVDTSQENLDPTVHYDVDTSQRNLDPADPYNVDTYQKDVDTVVPYDDQKSQINLGTIVSQDTEPSQNNDYPIISQDISVRRKSDLNIPYYVKVQQSLRNLGPAVHYNVGTGRSNLDPIAPYVIDTKERNLHLIAPYKVGARQVSPHPIIHGATNQRYYDPAVPYNVKTRQKNLDVTAPYFVEARQWNRHETNANQKPLQRNLETNRINLALVDAYEFDLSRTNPYSGKTYDFDVTRKRTNRHRKHKSHKKNRIYHLTGGPERDVDIYVVSVFLPDILSRYIDCENKARSAIINELKQMVIAMESKTCHQSS